MFRTEMIPLSMAAILLVIGAVGCGSAPSESQTTEMADHDHDHMAGDSDTDVSEALASLSEEDRHAAEAQKYCAVSQESLLGSMGEPIKLMIDGEPVFLCCEGCREAAMKDPAATLAAVAKLKKNNSASP